VSAAAQMVPPVIPALAAAKRRFARRRRQSGAVMFIVAMIIAVLASVGLYALAAASSEVRMSGNERQSTQTHYLATYGILGVTEHLIAPQATLQTDLMFGAPEPCLSLPNAPAIGGGYGQACRRILSTDLPWSNAAITVPYTGNTPYAPGANPGSFGQTPMSGDFFVETTGPAPIKHAGNDTAGHTCFVQLTLTSTGVTKPQYPWQPAGGLTAEYGGEGLEVQRARIVFGPTDHCTFNSGN